MNRVFQSDGTVRVTLTVAFRGNAFHSCFCRHVLRRCCLWAGVVASSGFFCGGGWGSFRTTDVIIERRSVLARSRSTAGKRVGKRTRLAVGVGLGGGLHDITGRDSRVFAELWSSVDTSSDGRTQRNSFRNEVDAEFMQRSVAGHSRHTVLAALKRI